MKILIVTAMYPPIRTGTSFYSQNLAKALTCRGHDVAVVTVETEGDSDPSPSLPVHRLPALRFSIRGMFKHFSVASLFPRNYMRMLRYARELGADVILLVNHYLDIAFLAVAAARLGGLPLVCSVGTQLQSADRVRHKVLNILDRLICGRLVFSSCRRVIAWDDQILCYLRDVHGDRLTHKVEIVNYGVNGDPETLAAHQHDYSLHNQILGVGSIVEQRDYTALVRAFSLICAQFPQLKVKLIGHIFYDKAVRLAAELGLAGRVVFTGELTHSEVLAELRRSDAYFVSLTGRYTGVGTASIEAMLLGIPTIINAYPCILGRALLEDMENVVLLSGLEPELIAERLRVVLSDATLRQRIGEAGRQFVSDEMSWTKIAADMEAVLDSVVGSRRQSGATTG